jgi:hypothetical protein
MRAGFLMWRGKFLAGIGVQKIQDIFTNSLFMMKIGVGVC